MKHASLPLLRRRFIALLGGAAVSVRTRTGGIRNRMRLSLALWAAVLSLPTAIILRALKEALAEMAYIEHRNIAFTYRWADGQIGRLPGLASDLVHRQVALIVAADEQSAHAAQRATAAIPIVFLSDEDHVKADAGNHSDRPKENVTGVTCSGDGKPNVKRLELLHELVPKRRVIAVMGPSNQQVFEDELADVLAAGRAIDVPHCGREIR